EPPELLSGRCIIGNRYVPWLNIIKYAVDHERRGFDASVVGNIGIPGQADILYIGIIDLLERAVAIFTISSARPHPLSRLTVSCTHTGMVDISGLRRSKCN